MKKSVTRKTKLLPTMTMMMAMTMMIIMMTASIMLFSTSMANAGSQANVHRKNAENSEAAAEVDRNTGWAHATAGIVCSVACATEWLGNASCAVTSSAVSLYDIYENGELGLQMAGSLFALSGVINSAEVVVVGTGSFEVEVACVAAGIHLVTSALKFHDMREAEEAATESRDIAQALDNLGSGNSTPNVGDGGAGSNNSNYTGPGYDNLSLTAANGIDLGASALVEADSDDGSSFSGQKSCTNARKSGDADGFFACLAGTATADPGISQGFLDATGLDLGEFLANGSGSANTSEILAAGLAGKGSSALSGVPARLDEYLADPENQTRIADAFGGRGGRVVASGGSAGNSFGSKGKKKNLLSGADFFKKGAKKKDNTKLGTAFSSKGMDPDSVMRDRKRNIFKRVSAAYQTAYQSNRVEKRNWASPFNREMNRQIQKRAKTQLGRLGSY